MIHHVNGSNWITCRGAPCRLAELDDALERNESDE